MKHYLIQRAALASLLLILPLSLIIGCDSGSEVVLTEDEAKALAASPAQYIPNDVGFLFMLKMSDIMADEWASDVVNKGLQDDEEMRAQFEALGLDPTKDIKEVALGVYPGSDSSMVVAIQADVVLDDLVKSLSPEDAVYVKPFDQDGLKGYLVNLPESNEEIYVIDEGDVLLGGTTPAMIKKGQATKSSGKSAVNSGAIASLLSDFDTSSHIWFVAGESAMADAMGRNPMMGGGGDSAPKSFIGSLNLTGGLQTDLRFKFNDEQKAQEMLQQLEGMKMMFGGQIVSQEPRMKPVIDALTMKADGNAFEIALYLTKGQLDDLQKLVEEKK